MAIRTKRADAADVSHTAGLLDTSEFQLFQMAYRSWHGYDADERLVEGYFVSYLYYDDVPFWVRHFVRQVQELDESDPQERVRGRWHALWYSGFALLLLLLLAHL